MRGGVDISDARTGILRLRIFLPQPFAGAGDPLRGSYFTTDDTGGKLFAVTTASPTVGGLAVVELASVPLGIGWLQPTQGFAAGGTPITLRGSGFQSGTTVTLGGAAAAVTFVNANTLKVTAPALKPGPQALTVTNPDGESVTLGAAFTVN